MFHWSLDRDMITRVVKAEWDDGAIGYAQVWSADVAKMTISECDGKLYVLYTQFGNADNPSGDHSDYSDYLMNGEMYLVASEDNGLTWDEPQNLTNSPTPNCAAGDCECDYWGSMARFGRIEVCGDNIGENVLDILYINDRDPGGAIPQSEGEITDNPVMWLTTPCREIIPDWICGDADNNEAVNVGDAVFLISYVFKNGPQPEQFAAGDANCDGSLNVGDAVWLISYIFKNGDPPCTDCP